MKWEPRTRLISVKVAFSAQGRCQLSIVRRDTNSDDKVTFAVKVGANS